MITYEYNEYVIGYVVKYHDGRECNFQFDKIFSNHPEPNFILKYGCEGDDTHRIFTEEELKEMSDFLNQQTDVKELSVAFTDAKYKGMEYRYPLFKSEIFDACNE